MSLEELLVDGDVLDGHETPPRLMLGDRVHEHRRIPVAQPVKENGDVNHRRDMPNAGCRMLMFDGAGHLASGIQHLAVRSLRLPAASSFFTASSVRSSPSAPQITVSLGTLSRRCSPFSIELLQHGNIFF